VSAIAPILQAYFIERLTQRQASPHTIGSYRDTFCLLLRFAQQHLSTPPSKLEFADVDASFVGAFLDHLERDRGNSATTRNNRLAAIHSLFSYAACAAPSTPHSSPASWRSHRNESTPPSSRSSPRPRPARY
jgi:site-specific recombinase XerD